MEEDQCLLNQSAGTNSGNGINEQSILKTGSNLEINEYANECIKEVCLNGEPLSKYQRMITKQFGVEFYKKCDSFIKEVKRSVDKKKFTNTSVSNLELLAKEINIPVDTVNIIYNHFNEQFAEEERQRLELERQKAEEIRRKEEEERRKIEYQRQKEEAERINKRNLKILKIVGIVIGVILAVSLVVSLFMANPVIFVIVLIVGLIVFFKIIR